MLSLSMWYVILMRNSNSIMSISYLLLNYILSLVTIKWIITLWGSNKLCAYYNPRKCEHVRYCHLELILLIILFLCGMFLKQVPFCLNVFTYSHFGSCLWWMFLVRFSSNMFSYISLENRLLQSTLCSCFALSREYLKLSRTFIYISIALKSYPSPCAYCLWRWSWISIQYTTKKFLHILLFHDNW